ncbi:hypothetical protein LTR85_011067 [Meristemomyces frigidus]|nr:hypothetical protein LTR85_011067 [Meristemomyces frigidus]
MSSTQRILLAVSSLLCFGLLRHFWDHTPNTPFSVWQLQENAGSNRSLDAAGTAAPPSADNATATSPDRLPQPTLGCARLPGAEEVVIVLKTGSTEIYEKLPIHLATTFACASDYLVYSDISQQFGPVPVRDALALVSQDMRDTHEDLAQYRLLQEHVASGADAAELKGDKSWSLDKCKFLPMITDAYRTFGRAKKWYVFIEADTYVSMHNLLHWLGQLDASEPVYAGAQVMIGDTEFAHGGSGFVMSSAAVEALTAVYAEQQIYWEQKLAHECCGDKLLAEVLLKAKPPIRLLMAFPLIQGETLTSLDWSPTHWCKPAVTWHHVDAATVDKLWQFERSWRDSDYPEDPILFSDYYEAFIHPRLTAANGAMAAWDNLSNEWVSERGSDSTITDPIGPGPAYTSAHACEALCRQQNQCLQWAWRPGLCRGGKAVQLGWALDNRPALGSAEDKIALVEGPASEGAVSGWLLERIEKWRVERGRCERRRRWTGATDREEEG